MSDIPTDDDYVPPPCRICGADIEWVACNKCEGDGFIEDDDGVNSPEWEQCPECQGWGGWWQCSRLPHGVGVAEEAAKARGESL